ncbi:MAG: SMC-Scp complex subunit ScpB [Deltaproteobacteria bacterium]|jgi:segregation and condensation protein B|nr:SMC-Scp complex subunit ScpB [Deltaproteobacteria bacterium]MDP2992105.1 SMC-Scp complex subunit ScpB [Deltaproteobacteria bacterium]TSA11099.1 MAG: SMC-Scp complex subunit ScpB [Deltaproteobacteria bacterium]
MSELKQILEALIFVSETPLRRDKIIDVLPEYKKEEIEAALVQLKDEYDVGGHSFTLYAVAEGFQFRTRPEYRDWIARLKKSAPARLSREAMETLAIIAYKQPILRSEIERIRGVDVSGVLKSLLEKKLVRIVGRNKELAGKPLIYGTTQRFLEVFDLRDLSSLPSLKEIKALTPDTVEGKERTPDLFDRSGGTGADS